MTVEYSFRCNNEDMATAAFMFWKYGDTYMWGADYVGRDDWDNWIITVNDT